MSRTAKLGLAKIMMAFSFVLIFTGASFYLNSSSSTDPTNAKVVSSSQHSQIFITTIDESNVKPTTDSSTTISDGSNNTTNTTPVTGDTGTSVSPATGGSTSNGNTGGNTYTPNTNSGSTNTYNPSVNNSAPVYVDTNNNLRRNIQSTYGVTVKYGNEVNGYSVGGLGTNVVTDSGTITQALNELNNTLSLYPSGFFQEMNNNGYSLSIYIIKGYSNSSVTGVTDHSNRNVVISIATDYPFQDSFTHESFHYIDYFIENKGGSYTSWNAFNPSGFNYGSYYSNWSYNRTFSEDAFFVNNYAQTDEYEDRASTFEYMMAGSKASCLNYGKPVWLKAKYMAEQVDYFYNTVSPSVTEYWERFIY